jgi:hypothetical protein
MQTAEQPRMICATCTYLSDGFRCQRVLSRQYSRKIPEPENFGCARWEVHPEVSVKRRVRDG